MPSVIEAILRSRATVVCARLLVTFPFWGSGLDKLLNFPGAVAEMSQHGLHPAVLFAALTIATELGGAAAIVLNRGAWLGAGALGVFTVLTVPIAHGFWAMTGAEALMHFFFAVEHVGLIGGLVAVAVLATRSRPATVRQDEERRVHAMAG